MHQSSQTPEGHSAHLEVFCMKNREGKTGNSRPVVFGGLCFCTTERNQTRNPQEAQSSTNVLSSRCSTFADQCEYVGFQMSREKYELFWGYTTLNIGLIPQALTIRKCGSLNSCHVQLQLTFCNCWKVCLEYQSIYLKIRIKMLLRNLHFDVCHWSQIDSGKKEWVV